MNKLICILLALMATIASLSVALAEYDDDDGFHANGGVYYLPDSELSSADGRSIDLD